MLWDALPSGLRKPLHGRALEFMRDSESQLSDAGLLHNCLVRAGDNLLSHAALDQFTPAVLRIIRTAQQMNRATKKNHSSCIRWRLIFLQCLQVFAPYLPLVIGQVGEIDPF